MSAQIYTRRAQPVPVTDHDVRLAIDEILPTVSVDQVLRQLASDDAREFLEIATARGDDRLVGQLYREAREAVAERMALDQLHRGEPYTTATARERFRAVLQASVIARANRAPQQ